MTEEARATLETYRFLYEAHPDPATQGRLLLLDGLICRKEGRLEESEEKLRRLASHYAEHDLTFDLTLATLEWAASLVLLGRFPRRPRSCGRSIPSSSAGAFPWTFSAPGGSSRKPSVRSPSSRYAFRELSLTVRRRWYGRNAVGSDQRDPEP